MADNRKAGTCIYWQLFWSFFKIGAFTFGGGWAMISLIEREMVDKYKWIKRDEFLDLLSLSQSLPGVMAVNIAVSVGDKLRGLRGCSRNNTAVIFNYFGNCRISYSRHYK